MRVSTLNVRNVICIVKYTSPLKTSTHYRRLGLSTRSGSCDRSDPDVMIKAYSRSCFNDVPPCKLVPSSCVGSVATSAVAFLHVRTLASHLVMLIFGPFMFF